MSASHWIIYPSSGKCSGCGAPVRAGDDAKVVFVLGQLDAQVVACGNCSDEPSATVGQDDELDEGEEDEDELPSHVPLPMLQLREIQLSACTRAMREVANELEALALTTLATKLNRVRAGLPAEPEEDEEDNG